MMKCDDEKSFVVVFLFFFTTRTRKIKLAFHVRTWLFTELAGKEDVGICTSELEIENSVGFCFGSLILAKDTSLVNPDT